jgi:hypothetical protein
MKPVYILVPSVLSLACAGALYGAALKARQASEYDPFKEFPHPVTAPMTAATGAMALKTATPFAMKDAFGKPVQIGGAGLARPQFVYFINHGCPCSYAAEPLFHALAEQFKGKVDFVGVTNASDDDAKKWVNENSVPYPVAPNPKLDVMHAYGAISSAYSALIGTDGKILKMWPGFSKDLLEDMNRQMALASKTAEKPFDTLYAPVKPATGCAFG